MGRPTMYREVAQSNDHMAHERILASTPTLYGLTYDGEWLIQVQLTEHMVANNPIKKYFRHLYATPGQARSQAEKVRRRYGVEPQIVEIKADDILGD